MSTTTTSTQTIFIEAGTYDEQVYIPKLAGELIIYGQTEECVLQIIKTQNHADWLSMISDTSYSSNTVTITYNLSLASVSDDDETGEDRTE